ncbi:MAG: response regulator transcription factor [Bacteroidales bacterium]|nr:response regulator transcription factor [Bacteroidales bacterium]
MNKLFKRNICIVEGDALEGKKLARGFAKYNAHVILKSDILEVLEMSKSMRFDALIIGRVENRLVISQQIMDIDVTIPIVFICKDEAQKQEAEQYDYRFNAILQPFTSTRLNEFVNDIKRSDLPNVTYKLGRYTFDYNTRSLVYLSENGQTLQQILTKKEAGLLLMLASNKDKVVLRNKILNNFWYSESYNYSRSMDVYITRLRGYLSMDKSVKIENNHSVGYKLTY